MNKKVFLVVIPDYERVMNVWLSRETFTNAHKLSQNPNNNQINFFVFPWNINYKNGAKDLKICDFWHKERLWKIYSRSMKDLWRFSKGL